MCCLTMAIRLTGWFEDLCSELGFWSVVNTTCRQRYGKILPFYDTSDYYPGEPNPQDIQLLLWHNLYVGYPTVEKPYLYFGGS